jgi:hypothetical protein
VKGRLRRPARSDAAGHAPASVHDVLRSPAKPLASEVRAVMEPRFGHDFSRVKVHADDRAARSARDVGALAYTVGSDVVFAERRYDPQSQSGQALIAHELAHVVQNRNGSGGSPTTGLAIGSAGDPAEARAQSGSQAALRGDSVPDLGNAPGGTLLRAVDTNGGVFDTSLYNPFSGSDPTSPTGLSVGADIDLTFMPNALVEADAIGLTQTVKRLSSPAPGGAVTFPTFTTSRNADLYTRPDGTFGPAIDQGDPNRGQPDTLPNTNPLYTVENTPGNVSATLTDVGATPGAGQHGFRRKTSGGFTVQPAVLVDRARHPLQFPGQEVVNTFEATALVLTGPMSGTYLGSIEWGWEADLKGKVSVFPLRMISAGVPSDELMEAAEIWNTASFNDPSTGASHGTVDLPIIHQKVPTGRRRPTGRGTEMLLALLSYIDSELLPLSAGPDKANKEFERSAVEAELKERTVDVSVQVFSKQDRVGADDVHIKVLSGKLSSSTDMRLKKGGQGTFHASLEGLLPIGNDVIVEIYEKDLGRLRPDDQIARIVWEPPFKPFSSRYKAGRADYQVGVQFNR